MNFRYEVKTPDGETKEGSIDAPNLDLAVNALQRNNFIIISITPEEFQGGAPSIKKLLSIFERVNMRDVVIVSRQLATLFEAKVPVVDSFKILVSEAPSGVLQKHLQEVLDDLQGGLPISQAMSRHPDVFSKFYVSMVKAGEESGELEKIFSFLADYLDRTYQLVNRVRNALIYPAFVLSAFVIVMVLMITIVIPNLSAVIIESGQEIPVYTKIVIATSDILRAYGIFILAFLIILGIVGWRYAQGVMGQETIGRLQISLPYFGDLYKKLYMARFSDNLQTLISGGVPIVRALEITADVVGSTIYSRIITEARDAVRAGSSISGALVVYPEVPKLVSQMVKVGEETGKLDFILRTLAKFYTQEVNVAVDNLVNLIEPILILILGLGVGVLVASILIPIYNISSAI